MVLIMPIGIGLALYYPQINSNWQIENVVFNPEIMLPFSSGRIGKRKIYPTIEER